MKEQISLGGEPTLTVSWSLYFPTRNKDQHKKKVEVSPQRCISRKEKKKKKKKKRSPTRRINLLDLSDKFFFFYKFYHKLEGK